MPTLAKKFCSGGCGALVERGRCPVCSSNRETRRGSAAKRGYGSRWRRARLLFLAASCESCRVLGLVSANCATCRGTGLQNSFCRDPYGDHGERLERATDVDHVIPHRGDPVLFWKRSNWQGLCQACHGRKTVEENPK